jgi:uncharacterized membrane protein
MYLKHKLGEKQQCKWVKTSGWLHRKVLLVLVICKHSRSNIIVTWNI